MLLQYLIIFELVNFKFASKKFSGLVSYSKRFKKICSLMNEVFDDYLWNELLKENFVFLKKVKPTFSHDLSTFFYLKYRICSVLVNFLCTQFLVIFVFVKDIVTI